MQCTYTYTIYMYVLKLINNNNVYITIHKPMQLTYITNYKLYFKFNFGKMHNIEFDIL